MAYNVQSNWRFGLDKRRSSLTSQPGELEELNNGHINQGGEIEKRKMFKRIVLPTSPVNFGLEAAQDSLVVFGSQEDTGALWPSNVRYERLIHPTSPTQDMSGIITSTTFAGKTFAVAAYGIGSDKVYAFYDTVPIIDFYSGLVSFWFLQSDVQIAIAAHLVDLINRLSPKFTAVQQANPNENKVNVTGQYGLDYTIDDIVSSLHGLFNISNTVPMTAPITGLPAVGSFRVVAGSVSAGTNKVTKVEVNGVTVTNAAVDYNLDNIRTAFNIAASINTKVSTPDYTAIAVQDVVQIYGLPSASPSPNGYEVKVTAAGNVCIGLCSFLIEGTSFTVTALTVDGVNILTTTFALSTTLTALCAAIVTNINANTTAGTAHGYLAFSSANNIFLSKAVTSNLDKPLTVSATFTGVDGVLTDKPTAGAGGVLKATIPVGPINQIVLVPITGAKNFATTDYITCDPSGGSGVYKTFLWAVSPGSSTGDIQIESKDSRSTKFRSPLMGTGGGQSSDGNSLGVGRFNCTVTDSNGAKATSNDMLVVFFPSRFQIP